MARTCRRAVAGRERIARWHTVRIAVLRIRCTLWRVRLVLVHAHAIWHVLRIVLCLVRQSGLLCVRRTLLWGRRDARRLLLGCRRVRTILWCQAVRFRFAGPVHRSRVVLLALLGGGTGNRRQHGGRLFVCRCGRCRVQIFGVRANVGVGMVLVGACVLVRRAGRPIIVVVSHRLSLYVSS